MEREEFYNKHSEMMNKHNIFCVPDCDYAPLMTGCYYYDNLVDGSDDDRFITHIMGITIGNDEVCGDVDGYLELLLQSIEEYRADPIKFKENI